jgi:hypothetical protein
MLCPLVACNVTEPCVFNWLLVGLMKLSSLCCGPRPSQLRITRTGKRSPGPAWPQWGGESVGCLATVHSKGQMPRHGVKGLERGSERVHRGLAFTACFLCLLQPECQVDGMGWGAVGEKDPVALAFLTFSVLQAGCPLAAVSLVFH